MLDSRADNIEYVFHPREIGSDQCNHITCYWYIPTEGVMLVASADLLLKGEFLFFRPSSRTWIPVADGSGSF